MSADPWEGIVTPVEVGRIAARRVSADHRCDFFWGKDHENRVLLMLQHDVASTPRNPLPHLKGLSVECRPGMNARGVVVIRLLDSTLRDIFRTLSEDILRVAGAMETDRKAVATTIARTWRWHHLLRGGGSDRLSDEEQKGLIGELVVLHRHLLPRLPAFDSVSAWHGPLGAAKDFEIGRIAIECKARRGSSAPFVQISSEHQLDEDGWDTLLLHVVELDRYVPGSPDDRVVTITDMVRMVIKAIGDADPLAADLFAARLAAAGVRDEDDYENDRWVEGQSRVFEVRTDFPRLTPGRVSTGIRGIRYSIDLATCQQHVVASEHIASLLGTR